MGTERGKILLLSSVFGNHWPGTKYKLCKSAVRQKKNEIKSLNCLVEKLF